MQLKIDDTTGDLVIENNEFQFISGVDEIRQLLISRLRTFYGEYFLDTSRGIPYYQTIFQKGTSPNLIYSLFTTVIIETDGITELEQLDIDFEAATRTCTVTLSAKAEDGRIEFSLPLGVV